MNDIGFPTASLADTSPAQDPSVVKVCDSRDGLTLIAGPDADLVIWRRSLDPDLSEWIEELSPPLLPSIELESTVLDLRKVLVEALDQCPTPSGEMRDRLIADVVSLARAFATVIQSDRVNVRLERVEDDACWRFHRDYVPYRMLTTYRGPTTEWVKPELADDALQSQRGYSGPIERLGLHDVAIFKGRSKAEARGLVHRSPPMSGVQDSRLLLCVNSASR